MKSLKSAEKEHIIHQVRIIKSLVEKLDKRVHTNKPIIDILLLLKNISGVIWSLGIFIISKCVGVKEADKSKITKFLK